MSKERGTSNVPMIMGIIGGVLGIPAAFCSGACASVITSGSASSGEIGSFYLAAAIIGAVLGFIGGLLGKKSPKVAGILMLLGTLLAGITLIAGNMLALVVAILFLLGGIFCFTQDKE